MLSSETWVPHCIYDCDQLFWRAFPDSLLITQDYFVLLILLFMDFLRVITIQERGVPSFWIYCPTRKIQSSQMSSACLSRTPIWDRKPMVILDSYHQLLRAVFYAFTLLWKVHAVKYIYLIVFPSTRHINWLTAVYLSFLWRISTYM